MEMNDKRGDSARRRRVGRNGGDQHAECGAGRGGGQAYGQQTAEVAEDVESEEHRPAQKSAGDLDQPEQDPKNKPGPKDGVAGRTGGGQQALEYP